jgi:Tfp pilus assembly protein PilV
MNLRNRNHIGPARRGGLTLIDAMLSIVILNIVVLALTYTVVSGHQQVRVGADSAHAMTLARDLMEEVISREYSEPDGDTTLGPDLGELARADFDDIDDYHNYAQAAGALTDVAGDTLGEPWQKYSRSVTVAADTIDVTDLGMTVHGKTVTVTVTDGNNSTWTLTRFFAKP